MECKHFGVNEDVININNGDVVGDEGFSINSFTNTRRICVSDATLVKLYATSKPYRFNIEAETTDRENVLKMRAKHTWARSETRGGFYTKFKIFGRGVVILKNSRGIQSGSFQKFLWGRD